MNKLTATRKDWSYPPVDSHMPSITVVVPVRNEEAHIAATLDQLLDQDAQGISVEIFVVDGESTDQTVSIVERYAQSHPQIHLLTNPRRLSSAARNLAIKNSQSDYFVVVDGHCEIPSRRYFKDVVNAFQESSADCLGRPQPLEVSQATPLQRAIALARSSRLGHHPESFIYSDTPQFVPAKSVAVAYRREVFTKVGLFDESFDAHEDGEFNFRCDLAELRCYLDPKLTVKYFPRTTLIGLFRQMVRYGRGRVRLMRKHHGAVTFATLVPAAFVLGTTVGPLFCEALPSLWPVYLSTLALYLALTSFESARIAFLTGEWSLLPWLPPVFGAIHFGSGCGLLLEWAAGKRIRRTSLCSEID